MQKASNWSSALDKRVDLVTISKPRGRQLRGRSSAPSQIAPAWPSFSVVIPSYQRRDIVCETVRALSRTIYPGPLELIVVVDGSTDGTGDALRTNSCPFDLRIIEQQNLGASRARNRGAAEARHDVILFLDDDMMVEPNLIEEHGRAYLQDADAVIGHATIHPESPDGFLPHSVARGLASSPVRTPLTPFDIFTGQLSVRRIVFERLGGFDPTLTSGSAFGNEDADFGVRLLARYEVRYSRSAVSRQLYAVTPRQYMQRAARAAAADLAFTRKHRQLANHLFELKGASRPLTRFVYRPLSRIPFVPHWLGALAVSLAEAAMRTPLRANRMLARFFSGARATVYWSSLRASGWPLASRRVLVLCYHAIGDFRHDPVLAPYCVPPELFAKQLDSLRRRGYSFISPDELAAFLNDNVPVPRRAVLLTFDDGYSELLNLARDELSKRGIEGLVFLVTGLRTNEWDRSSGAATLDLLDVEEQRQVASFGLEVGSHTHTHRLLTKLSGSELDAEVKKSADELTMRSLPRPRFFAYPYGARNQACAEAVQRAGFVAAFGPKQARLNRKSPIFDLPRVHIGAGDRGWRFVAKTACPSTHGWLVKTTNAIQRRLSRAARIWRHDA